MSSIQMDLKKILDVFYGYVKEIKNDNVYIDLESQSPSKSDRNLIFKVDFITNNNLEKDSHFEYTIYKSLSTGSLSYQIIPM